VSAAAIIAIVVGGCLVVFGAIAVMMIWLRRSYNTHEAGALARLAEQPWTYEERNDSYVALYNDRPLPPYFRAENPIARPPRASAAHHVVTGTHRGRSFLAAEFDVYLFHRGEHIRQRCVWVRTPAARPGLSLRKVLGPQNAINRALGWDYPKSGDPEFDRRFEVSADDNRFAQAVLHPRMIQFLLHDPRPFRAVLMTADTIDLTDPIQDHRDPLDLIPALDLRCDILDLVPLAVWA
jgi:hypothetical protein